VSVFKRGSFAFGFLQVLSGDSAVVKGDPQGCPRHKLKASLTHAPILTPPLDGKPLYLYVAATTQVVNVVIVVERMEEGHALPVQRPVYYISEVLSDTKTRYPQVQKLLYAVVLAWCKLRHYFEAHPVTVVSSIPLGEIVGDSPRGPLKQWGKPHLKPATKPKHVEPNHAGA
jgi:hypothetical protein